MSKFKLRLVYQEKNFLVPMDSKKTLKDLRYQVEKRFKIPCSGFLLDDYHVSLEDDICDIIDNPKKERLCILVGDIDCTSPSKAAEQKANVEMNAKMKKELLDVQNACDEALQQVEKLEKKLEDAKQKNKKLSSEKKSLANEYKLLDARVVELEARNKELEEALQHAISKPLPPPKRQQSNERLEAINLPQAPPSDPKPKAASGNPGNPSDYICLSPTTCLSNPDLTQSASEHKEEEIDEAVLDPTHPHYQPASPEVLKVEEKITDQVEAVEEDQWALIEKRMAERQRKKREKEMAARQPLPVPKKLGSEDEDSTGELPEDARKSIQEKMREKMSERLKDRKGPRLKLEPTRKPKQRRKSAPQKAVAAKLSVPKNNSMPPTDSDDDLGLDSSNEDQDVPVPTESQSADEGLTPKSRIAAKMAERMKQRVGPRLSLAPTRKARDIKKQEAMNRRRSMPVKSKADEPPPSSGVMSAKERKRIGRMNLEIGDKLELSSNRTGILKFMGETEFAPNGVLFGLELIGGSLGDNSGMVDGIKYFECEPNRGIFITSKDIRKKARKPKAKEPKRAVYKRRLERILQEFNPNRVKTIPALLDKNQGNEHHLYLKVCKKYYVSPEKEYLDDTDAKG